LITSSVDIFLILQTHLNLSPEAIAYYQMIQKFADPEKTGRYAGAAVTNMFRSTKLSNPDLGKVDVVMLYS
jgi:hypothetical protein